MGNTRDTFETAIKMFAEKKSMINNNKNMNKFSEQLKDINKVISKKDSLVKEFIGLHRDSEKKKYTNLGRLTAEMKKIAAKQEIFLMAADLCEKEEEKQALIAKSEALDNHPAMVGYGKYLKGLQYLAGMTKTLDPDILEFFRKELRENLPLENNRDYERYRLGEEAYVSKLKKELPKLIKERDSKQEAYDKKIEESANKQLTEEEKESLAREKIALDKVISLISTYRTETSTAMKPYKHLQQEYRKNVAPAKAMEVYAKTKSDAGSFIEQFLGDYKNTTPNLNRERPFRDRMTPGAFLMGRMLNAGYSLEDIVNPNAFLADKKKYGQEYMEHRQNNDRAWYLEEMYKGAEGIMKGIEKYCIDHKNELKTVKDMTLHADTLSLTAVLCFDMFQELHICKEFVAPDSQQKYSDLADKASMYNFLSGFGGASRVDYNLVGITDLDSATVADEMRRQLYMKMFLDELKKDNPDIESLLSTAPQLASISNQILTLPEITSKFDEDDQLKLDELKEEDMKVLGSMMNMEFIVENDISTAVLKAPVKVVKPPVDSFLRDGQNIDRVVFRNGKQLVSTNVSVKLEVKREVNKESLFKTAEAKGMRGKNDKDNGTEFNRMMKAFDAAKEKFKKGELSTESLEDLSDLKKAAKAYVGAKRNQKGYGSNGSLDKDIDAKMLGKKSGKSIFTSRGKAKYEFAIHILERVQELENKLSSIEKQNDNKEIKVTEKQELQNDGEELAF